MSTAKPKLLITRNDFPKVPSYKELEEIFDIFEWNSAEKGKMPADEFNTHLKESTALICVPQNIVNKQVLSEFGDKIKVISTYSVGLDHLEIPEIKKKGIRVASVGDMQSDTVAEFTVGLAIAAARKFQQRIAFIRSGTWETNVVSINDNGLTLIGATVGIIGLGAIGLATAQMLKGFKVSRILYTSRQEKPGGKALGAEKVSLDELCSKCSFIFVTCALTKETTNLVGPKQFDLMKSNTILINTSRGGLIDQDALIDALKNNKIAGAALDVMTPEPLPGNHPLCKFENCLLTPHVSSSTRECRQLMMDITIKNIINGYKNLPMTAEL